MDRSNFSDKSPGQLLQVKCPHKDWAFIPEELPPKWRMENSLWPILAEAREALGTLNGIGHALADPDLLLRPLQNKEAIASSSIEGTFVTPQELLLFEINPSEPNSSTEKAADWQEVFNYKRAMRGGIEALRITTLNDVVVRGIHQELMHGVRGRDKLPGQYRRKQVQIGSGGRFIPAPPEHVQSLMDNLNQFVNSDENTFDPLVKSFMVHYQFETIHPFEDGNGRVGRALLALMISKWHGHDHPWLYLSAYFEQFREEYVENLYRVSTAGEWSRWIEFCLRATISQANDSIARCREFLRLKKEFHERVTSPGKRTHKLIESLFTHPIVTIPAWRQKAEIAYRSAQRDLEHLVEAGILTDVPSAHPRFFYALELMKAAFDW